MMSGSEQLVRDVVQMQEKKERSMYEELYGKELTEQGNCLARELALSAKDQ